jgi:dihydrofolate reductase
MKKNSVFIATSLDGYIADKDGRLYGLHALLNPDNNDMGSAAFTNSIDALIMGRTIFETFCGLDCDWPYKLVFVLSNKLNEIPESHQGKVFLVKNSLTEILAQIHQKGHHRLS